MFAYPNRLWQDIAAHGESERFMAGFNLDQLLQFQLPQVRCTGCLALHTASTVPALCGCCGQPLEDARPLHFADPIVHGQHLARIARELRQSQATSVPTFPPMRALFETLAAAQQFVHFTTYGISAMLLGAVKLASFHIDVRGVISGIKNDSLLKELMSFPDESPNLQLRLAQQEAHSFPHQKIIVVDGLVAFKGSANLTDYGWRKAAFGREYIEMVTDMNEVAELHNRFFSPVWAAFEVGSDTQPSPAAP
jgi:hypothetical protein